MASHSHLKSSSLSFSSNFHLGDHRQHNFLFLGISSFIAGKFSLDFQRKVSKTRRRVKNLFTSNLISGFEPVLFCQLIASVCFKSKTFLWDCYQLKFFFNQFTFYKLHKTPFSEYNLHKFQQPWMHLLKIFSPKIIKFTKRETFLPRD